MSDSSKLLIVVLAVASYWYKVRCNLSMVITKLSKGDLAGLIYTSLRLMLTVLTVSGVSMPRLRDAHRSWL